MLDVQTSITEIQAPLKHVFEYTMTQKSKLLELTFTFMDMGMYHTISSFAIISYNQHGNFMVDGQSEPNEASALFSVFGWHYSRYIADIN